MKIDICFVTDDSYAMPTCVTISSILKSKKESTICNVYILCKNVSQYKKEKFNQLNTDTFIIKNIDVEEKEDFSKYRIEGIPATPTSIYKFFIPDILKDIKKVLYLDGDIIVQKDLTELYNLDIDNYFLGAVKDTNGLDNSVFTKRNYQYFNSGVMLMNLEKMRKHNISEKLLEYRKNGYNKLMDQDTFNYVLRETVLLLPFNYNTQMNTLSTALQKNKKYNIEKFKVYWNIPNEITTIKQIFDNATILHYTTAKPWKFYDGYGNDEWYRNYIESPYGKETIERQSYYVSKLVNSTTYQVGKKITYPLKYLKNIFSKKRDKKYKKFLTTFIKK